jgi:hypothetical protein
MVSPCFPNKTGKTKIGYPHTVGFCVAQNRRVGFAQQWSTSVLLLWPQHVLTLGPGMAKHWPIYHSPMDEWPGIPPKKNMANTYNLNIYIYMWIINRPQNLPRSNCGSSPVSVGFTTYYYTKKTLSNQPVGCICLCPLLVDRHADVGEGCSTLNPLGPWYV